MSAATGRLTTAAAIMAEILELPVESVPENASVHNYPAWDSLAHVKLMLALEEITGSPVDPGRIATMADLKSVDKYLQDVSGKSSTSG
jgi:acyl carrier protein